MKTVYSYLCQHDRFTLGLVTALTLGAWACYFTPVVVPGTGNIGFLVCFGALTAIWGVLVTGTCLDWSTIR